MSCFNKNEISNDTLKELRTVNLTLKLSTTTVGYFETLFATTYRKSATENFLLDGGAG